jgi:hypothetical protein
MEKEKITQREIDWLYWTHMAVRDGMSLTEKDEDDITEILLKFDRDSTLGLTNLGRLDMNWLIRHLGYVDPNVNELIIQNLESVLLTKENG